MSDDGEDYSDNNSGSDSENEDTDTKKPTTFRPIILNKNKTVDDIIESDEDISSDDDSVVDDADEVDDVDGLFGGANEEI